MTVSLREMRGNAADQQWIEGVYGDYLEDLGLLNTGIFPALGEIGHRQPDHVQRWLVDRAAVPLTILFNGQQAGFAMIVREAGGSRHADYRLAEFFIDRRHRRRGIGSSAVRLILDRFAGSWEIIEHVRNSGAVDFWRKTVFAYTRGNYRERVQNGEVRQYFTSAVARGTSR